ncbi:MAG: acyl-CoA thioesterase [Acutalibacteraceae bacterium]
METYKHTVHYYETDRMGFVHHSNYIRWFEEARDSFFEKIGAPYSVTETYGLICPVLSVGCEYKKSCYYGENILIYVTLEKVTNVRFFVSYKVMSEDGELRATGTSSHCFLNSEGQVVSLKRVRPELFEIMLGNVGKTV